MRRLTDILLWPVRFGFICGTLALAGFAIAAILGAVHPAFDLFNHLQPILLVGTLAALLLTPVFLASVRWRAFNMAVAATGLAASAVAIVPEAVSAFDPLPPEPSDGSAVYTLYTHNLFGLNRDADRVFAAIEAEAPDIIVLQEYFYDMRIALDPLLRDSYPFASICVGGRRENIAIYARIPFEAEQFGCARGDDSRIARILARFTSETGDQFSVLTTHLDWPVQISPLRTAPSISAGIDAAFARQHGQFADLEAALTKIPGPLVVAGDFNATSWSYALSDLEAVGGLTRHTRSMLSYPTLLYIRGWRPVIPFLPLDQILSRGGVSFHAVGLTPAAGSDHLGVVGRFSVSEQTDP